MPDPVPSLSAGVEAAKKRLRASNALGAIDASYTVRLVLEAAVPELERELAECKEALEAIAKSDCYCHGGDEGSVCDTCIARSVVDRGVS